MDKRQIFSNTICWGFILWLFGYAFGFVFFPFVPKETIGWYILPFGVSFTLWVLFNKIKRDKFGCYFGLGLIWVLIAVSFDYLFIVKLLNSSDYYKTDVYTYYLLTFILPIIVGVYKKSKKQF